MEEPTKLDPTASSEIQILILVHLEYCLPRCFYCAFVFSRLGKIPLLSV